MDTSSMIEQTGTSVDRCERDYDCPVCHSRRLATFSRGPRWAARCARCGLVGAHPQPDDDELAAIYDAAYYQRFGFIGDARDACHAMKQAGFDCLLRCAEQFASPGRMLDIGCGLGDMLVAATRRGWEATGVEPHASALDAASATHAVAIHQCPFEDFESEEPFDLVTCSDVLEHLRRPDAALALAADLLRPGGVLIITQSMCRAPLPPCLAGDGRIFIATICGTLTVHRSCHWPKRQGFGWFRVPARKRCINWTTCCAS